MNERIRAVAPASPALDVEVDARPAYELLIGLYALTAPDDAEAPETWVPRLDACSAPLRRAVEAIGPRSGELWLHLLGLAIELPASSADDFVAAVAGVAPRELRRHLVGVYVPAWEAAVGADTLERAAGGDAKAAAKLLRDRCYYGGHARASLAQLLPLPAAQVRRLVVGVLERFAEEVFTPRAAALCRRLRADAVAKRRLVRGQPIETAVASVTGGYAYEPETGVDGVLLIPHLAAAPWLLLCQHRTTRIICTPALDTDAERDLRSRALRLGRALGDERRVEILRRLAAGEASLNELADSTGLVKSTVHHHVAVLRQAGLVNLRGNARGYWYSLRADGGDAARALLDELLG